MSGKRFTVDVLAPDYRSKIGTFEPSNLLSASCSWMWWQVATASLYVREEGPEAAQLLRCLDIPVPVTMKAPGFPRWDGYVVYASLEKESGAPGRITATMVSNRKWIDRVLAAPAPGLPWSNQSGSEYDTRTGPLGTVVRSYIQANINRINATGPDLPLVVTPVPLNDDSPVITLNGRNEKIGDLIEPSIEANGYDVVSYLWLPGDPQPPGLTLTQSSVVIDVVKGREKAYVNFTDRSGGIAKRTVSVKSPQATAVIVGGPGEGKDRAFNYVRDVAPTPEPTKAAQLILDRLLLVKPPLTVAASIIRDRIDAGSDFNPDWTWEYAPGSVFQYSRTLIGLYGGDPNNGQAAVNWLNAYIAANGGEPTLKASAMSQAAQTILSRFRSIQLTDAAKAAELVRDRVASGQPYFEDFTWDNCPQIVEANNGALVDFYRGRGAWNDRGRVVEMMNTYIRVYGLVSTLNRDWTYLGDSDDVTFYGPQLVQLYGGDPMDVRRAIGWLSSYVDARTNQEFFSDWTWYDAPILVGIHRERLLREYGGDPNNWPTVRSWLQNYVTTHDGASVTQYSGNYSEVFFDATSDADTETRLTKGRDRLAELAGTVGMLIEIQDGFPWKAGPTNDYWVGDYVRATFGEIASADYITRVTATSNPEGFKISAQLGDPNMTETSDIKLANIVAQLVQEVSALKSKR